MIKNIQLSTALFATALLSGVALAPMIASAHPAERTVKAEPARQVRLAAAATKEVEGTKADVREDKAEAKAARKADKAEAKADRAEDTLLTTVLGEGVLAVEVTPVAVAPDDSEQRAVRLQRQTQLAPGEI
ncbi:MAG: hypothetical protein H0U98_11030 [Alphaproteobacteria bacterium]|nr:hypothetical protein [Alphaproteobacteria bacterium]